MTPPPLRGGAGDPTSRWRRTDRRIGRSASRDAARARRGAAPRRRGAAHAAPRLPPASPATRPPAAVVVPTAFAAAADGRTHLEHLVDSMEGTLGPRDRVVVVTDGAPVPEELRAMSAARRVHRVVEVQRPFSFPDRVNSGVASGDEPVVVLLNDDTEVISPDWLDRLAATAVVPGVGAVGATLLYPDGTLQHAGLTTTERLPTHAYYGWDPDDPGVPQQDRVVWGVTGACLAVTRANFDRFGGLSEEFPLNYNDVDFCCKVDRAGLANVVLASVRLRHAETRTRPRELTADEVHALQRRWFHRLGPDPLTLDTAALVDRRWAT